MWTAKIRFNSKGTLISSRTTKYKITIFGFPLSYYYEKKWIIVQITGTALGKEKSINDFVKDLKKDPRVIDFEIDNDFFIGIIKEPMFAKAVYNKEIIHLSPACISDNDYETIHIGSFKRESIIKAFNALKENRSGELLSIQKKNVKSISIMKLHPELTEKQKNAMHLAIKEGYYKSPRKIDLQKLAKLSKLSFSTYQVHLRKAEGKLMPYFFE